MKGQAHFALPYYVVEGHKDRRAPESACFSRLCSTPLRSLVILTFSLSSFLGCVLEVTANKWWGLVLIGVLSGGGLSLGSLTHDFLESAHLLGADFLHDLGHHVLELLGDSLTLNRDEGVLEGVVDSRLSEVKDGVVLVEEVGGLNVGDVLRLELVDDGHQFLVLGDLSNVSGSFGVDSSLSSFSSHLLVSSTESGLHSGAGGLDLGG